MESCCGRRKTPGYDVLVTTDQGIPHQRNLAERRISILVVRYPLQELFVPLFDPVHALLETHTIIITRNPLNTPRAYPPHSSAAHRSAIAGTGR